MTDSTPLGDFAGLLTAARQQVEPQRLLFVFARRELPLGATAAQRERFERGNGGALTPCLCVDKAPEEVSDFAALRAESEQTGQPWDVVFVGALAGRAGVAPNSDEAAQPLRFMLKAIQDGRIASFAAFDRAGEALNFI